MKQPVECKTEENTALSQLIIIKKNYQQLF